MMAREDDQVAKFNQAIQVVKLIDDKNFKLVTDLSLDEAYLKPVRDEVISFLLKCEEKKVGLGFLDHPLSRQEIIKNLIRRREQKLIKSASVPDVTANEDGFQSLFAKRSKAHLDGKRHRTIDDVEGDFKHNYRDNNQRAQKHGREEKQAESSNK